MPVRAAVGALALAFLLIVSGCNTATTALNSAAVEEQNANAEAAQTAEGAEQNGEEAKDSAAKQESNIIRRESTVSQKGTNIRALVNGEPITNYDVQRRAAFLSLRRVGGNRNQKALEELVDEKIKMQEARRRNVVAANAEVDEAFANFAKSNRMSTSQMSNILAQSGVTSAHFKDFIRGQMSWSRAVGSKFREETLSKSSQEVMRDIREAGGAKPETTEYLLEQVIFVVPSSKRNAILAQRRKEANAFRQTFTACGETVRQAAALRDVTVRTLPRVLEPRLPPFWEEEVKKTQEGQTTAVKDTERGVEFLAVCSRKNVSDDQVATVVEQQKDFEKFNDEGDAKANEFLGELKSKSRIIYR